MYKPINSLHTPTTYGAGSCSIHELYPGVLMSANFHYERKYIPEIQNKTQFDIQTVKLHFPPFKVQPELPPVPFPNAEFLRRPSPESEYDM